MTANKCRDFFKSADASLKAPFEDAADVGSEIEIDEEDTEMYEAVSELPETLRVAIHLHYYEGYSLKEIAGILDIAPSAVSMRLTRAKEILRKRFMGGSSYAG